MMPIDFLDASTPRKPRKNEANEKWEAYKEAMKQRNLNQVALDALHTLQHEREARPLRLVVDGSYTNQRILRNLPANTTLIGRIRKDARLNDLPENTPTRGRKRFYGEDLPTPEAIRKDASIPWRKVKAFAAGKIRTFQIKTFDRVRWRKAGEMDLRLVIIRAIPRKGPRGARAYCQPAYLICTDPQLALEDLLQSYIWRWDIEVNHRDEKTLLGVGQAQVRNPESAWSVPASAVAAYAMLQLAAIQAYGWDAKPNVIPPPQWRDPQKKRRASTLDLVNELRRELWAQAIHNMNLTDFKKPKPQNTKSVKYQPNLESALFTATA